MENKGKTASCKAPQSIFIVAVILMFIFFTPIISAFEIDNKLTYEKNDMKVTFENAFGLPLFGSELGTVELKSHKTVDEVVTYGVGRQETVTYYDFTNWETYVNGIGEIKFIDGNTGKEVNRDYTIVEWIIESIPRIKYETECNLNVNGTNVCTKVNKGFEYTDVGGWVEYTGGRDIPNRNIRLGVMVTIEENDYIDVIWEIVGKEITRHAFYDEGDVIERWDTSVQSGSFNAVATNNTFVWIADAAGTDIYEYWANSTYTGKTITSPTSPIAGLDYYNGFFYTTYDAANLVYKFFYNGTTNSNWDPAQTCVGGCPVGVAVDGTNIWILDGTNDQYLKYNMAGVYQTSTISTPDGTPGKIDNFEAPASFLYFTGRDGGQKIYKTYTNGTISKTFLANASVTAIIGIGVNPDGLFMYVVDDATGDTWVHAGPNTPVNPDTSPTIILNNPSNNTNQTTNTVSFNCTAWDDQDLVNVTFILDGVDNETTTPANNTLSTYIKTLVEGDTFWTCGAADNNSQTTTAGERLITIDTIFPILEILAPSAIIDSHTFNTDLDLNWSANDTNIDACIYQYEGVNTTVTCNDNTTGVNITNAVNRTIIFYVNDSFAHTTSNSVSWNYNFIETGTEASFAAFETDNESFKINVTTTQSITSFTAFLNYNGTSYEADSSCSSGNCEIEAIIDIPLLTTGQESENKTFFWQLSIFNGTGTSNINTSIQIQNISDINFGNCTATLNIQSINFTILKESDTTPLVANFDGSFEYYLGSGTVKKEANLSGTEFNSYDFCIDENEIFIVNSEITLSQTAYDTRLFSFFTQSYTNVNINQSLLLLNSTGSSKIIIEVKDQGLIPQEDIIVNISRFYPGTGQFVMVEHQITDEFGQIVTNLVEDTVKYRFTFSTKDNVVIKTSEDITVACRATFCVIPFVLEDTTDEFERFDNLTTYSYTFTFDNTTNMFTYSWNDQRGETATTRLEVTRYKLNGSEIVCNETSLEILSVMTCDVGSQRASYKAQVFRTVGSDVKRITIINVKVGDPSQIYGLEGLLWVFILLMTTIGIGAFNPSVGISLYCVGFVAMGILGVIAMPIPVFFANTLLCILFIWAVNKR